MDGEATTQDFISQAVTLSAQSILNFYVKVLEVSTLVDISDSEQVNNIHRLSTVVKNLIYAHSTISEYAKVEVVKAAIKTLNGIQTFFSDEQSNDITQDIKQECLDTLIGYLQHAAKDEQLDLFEL